MNRQMCAVILSFVFTMVTQASAENASSSETAGSTQPSVEQTLPFSLTISGGISLGSYEAGVNWALIDYMRKIRDDKSYTGRKPDLKVITGASAGAINSVITAMLWLVDWNQIQDNENRAPDTVNDNIIRNAWVRVGIDDLMPKEDKLYCNPTMTCPDSATLETEPEPKLADEMFARSAFKQSIVDIKKLLTYGKFKPGQFIDIALLATREEPIDIEKNGIIVKNQRFVFLLQFRTDEKGNGHFESNKVDYIDPSLGTIVYLPQNGMVDGHKIVEPHDLIRLMYASSAVPVAFGKVNLPYCSTEESGKPVPECPPGTSLVSSDFIDGGIFDNVPIGAALLLRKARILQTKSGTEKNHEVEQTSFFFISSSARRNVSEPFRHPIWKKRRTFGIDGILAFVPGFIDSASDHELYTALRSGDGHSYKLTVSDRYFPITGTYLGHFGAFLDSPFREFDYNAGVYDGIYDLAQFMKSRTGSMDYGAEVKEIYERLGLDRGDSASDVFSLIASQEHYHNKRLDAGWLWINNILPDSSCPESTMCIIFNSIIDTSKIPQIGDDSNDTFKKFISNLNKNNYIKVGNHSAEMTWIMQKYDKDFTVWYAPLVDRAGNRLQKLQVSESDTLQASESNLSHATGLRFLAGGIALGAGKFFRSDDTFSMPSSMNGPTWYELIPYEISTDVANGGASISYLGRMLLPFWNSSFDLKFTPVGYFMFGDEHVAFSQADLYFALNQVHRISSVGIGPTFDYLWREPDKFHRINTGGAFFIEVLQTLRMTVGVKDYQKDIKYGHNFYITLGIVDLPGTVKRLVNMTW